MDGSCKVQRLHAGREANRPGGDCCEGCELNMNLWLLTPLARFLRVWTCLLSNQQNKYR